MIDRALRDLASHIETPPTPDLVAGVLADLPPRRRTVLRRPALVAVGAVAAALVLVVAVLPAAREQVISWLGIAGVSVEPGSGELGADLDIGTPSTLDAAATMVGFDVLVPHVLGEPDAVFVDDDQRVWLLYEPRPDLPATAASNLGAIVTQFRPDVSPGITKELLVGTNAETLTVNGGFAIWIEGPHNVILDGLDATTVNGRSAGNTLLWEGPGITLRLETAVPLARAVEIARSFE